MNVNRIDPKAIDINMRGWISPEGTVFVGKDSHDGIANTILDEFGDEVNYGWTRLVSFVEKRQSTVVFDCQGSCDTEKEGVIRAIAKRITYPFDLVRVDRTTGQWDEWIGTLDDLIKFGIKGRRKTSFESRLEKVLNNLFEEFNLDSPEKNRQFWATIKKHKGDLEKVAKELDFKSWRDVHSLMMRYPGTSVRSPKPEGLRLLYNALRGKVKTLDKIMAFHKSGKANGTQSDYGKVAIDKVKNGSKLVGGIDVDQDLDKYIDELGLQRSGWLVFKPENSDIAAELGTFKPQSFLGDTMVGLALGYPANEVYNWVKHYHPTAL